MYVCMCVRVCVCVDSIPLSDVTECPYQLDKKRLKPKQVRACVRVYVCNVCVCVLACVCRREMRGRVWVGVCFAGVRGCVRLCVLARVCVRVEIMPFKHDVCLARKGSGLCARWI